MNRDVMEPHRDLHPLITVTGDERDHSQDRLLRQHRSAEHEREEKAPYRFKSLHRPRGSSASSSCSQVPDEADVSQLRSDLLYPDDRPRRSFTTAEEQSFNGHAGHATITGASRLWTPFWLSRIILIGFVLLFAALLTALLLVWYSSEEKNGFFVSSSTSQYTWTYGPTAVLVIVVGLWHQVDYHCKSLTPWLELRKGPVVASKSLLLDYVSPLQLVTLGKAISNGHVAVIATISGLFLLKIITIFATGLFALRTVLTSDLSFPINTTTKFDSVLASQFSTISFNPVTFSNAPVYAYYGHLAHGVPYNTGLNDDYVYTSFESAGAMPPNASLSSVVDAFQAFPNCSTIDVELDGPTTVYGLNESTFSTNLSLILPEGNGCANWSYVGVSVLDPLHVVVPPKQITGTMQGVYCSTANGSTTDLSNGPSAYLYTLTDVRYQQKLFANGTDNYAGVIAYANSTSRTVAKMSNVLCRPSYTITQLNVTNGTASSSDDTSHMRLSPVIPVKNYTLPDFSAWNMSSVFEAALSASKYLFAGSTIENQVSSTVFSLMAATQNSDNYEILLDASLLRSSAEAVYKGVVLQFVQQSLMSQNQAVSTGEATYPQKRLHIRPASLWVMAVGFALLIVLTVVVFFLAPVAVVSRDPNAIAAMAAILARSPDLNRELRAEGAVQDRVQRTILSPHHYRASVLGSDAGPPAFSIQVQPGGTRYLKPTGTTRGPLTWWQPLTLNFLVMILTVVFPIGIIIALEFLQRSSDRDGGLLDLSGRNFSEAYVHYIPALVMLLVATMFNSLNFNVALFTPFKALRAGNASSHRTMMNNLVSKAAPSALLEATSALNLGAILSIVGAMVASALTVIVSGLYSVQIVGLIGPSRSMNQLDMFNLTWNNSYSQDGGAAATLSLIEHGKISYPNFTYGEYVFPSLSLGALTAHTKSISIISGPSYASIPAIRANLSCSILPPSSYNVSYQTDVAVVNSQFDHLPPTCRFGGISANESFFQYQNIFPLDPEGKGVYAGAQLDLLFSDISLGTNYGEVNGNSIPDNPPGCPSLAFTFGYFNVNQPDKENITTMVCYQQLQQVYTSVTFLINSTVIDPRSPPVPDESTIKLLTNPRGSSDSTVFEYRLQNNLLNEMATFNGSGYLAATTNGLPDTSQTVDIFYQAVINGSEKIKPEDLVGPANQQRLLNATNRLYSRYLAQAINANMRQPCASSGCVTDPIIVKRQTSTLPSGPQTTLTISTPRLVQSASSKLTLQILLGVALICGILAYLLTPMRKVLPCNPCTIAGMMSLLAGSKLCWSTDEAVCECCGKLRPRGDGSGDADRMIHAGGEVDGYEDHEERDELIPRGAEWMSDKELRAVFSRMRYTLGWWRAGYRSDARSSAKKFGIDVGVRADGLDDQEWSLGSRSKRVPTDEYVHRTSRVPNWLLGPMKPEPEVSQTQTPALAEELSQNQIRGSKLPEWMLGPLQLDRVPLQVPEQDLGERGGQERARPAPPVPPHSSGRQSRLPEWLLGPLRPGPEDMATRGAYSRPGDGFPAGPEGGVPTSSRGGGGG